MEHSGDWGHQKGEGECLVMKTAELSALYFKQNEKIAGGVSLG